MSTEDGVRKASERFYAAVNRMANGDAGPMADVWSHSAAVTAMHPLGGRQSGWEQVRASWEQASQLFSDAQVELVDQFIQVAGDMAYELGLERGQAKLAGQQIAIENRVTNIYRREAEGWKIVHHHTDVTPAMLDLMSRLQAQT